MYRLSHDRRQIRHEARMLAALANMGYAAADQAIAQIAPRRDTQAPVVVERTLAFFGDKHIVRLIVRPRARTWSCVFSNR